MAFIGIIPALSSNKLPVVCSCGKVNGGDVTGNDQLDAAGDAGWNYKKHDGATADEETR